jgi:hypothetical protein
LSLKRVESDLADGWIVRHALGVISLLGVAVLGGASLAASRLKPSVGSWTETILSFAHPFVINLLSSLVVGVFVYFLLKSRNVAKKFGGSIQPKLLGRSDKKHPPELFTHAKSVVLIAVSAKGLVSRYTADFERALRNGTKFTVVLLDPKREDALQTFDRMTNPPMVTPASDIQSGVDQFTALFDRSISSVRLLPTTPPFSMICVEYAEGRKFVAVEVFSYKTAPGERSSFELDTQNGEQFWVDCYWSQMELMCADSKPVETRKD